MIFSSACAPAASRAEISAPFTLATTSDGRAWNAEARSQPPAASAAASDPEENGRRAASQQCIQAGGAPPIPRRRSPRAEGARVAARAPRRPRTARGAGAVGDAHRRVRRGYRKSRSRPGRLPWRDTGRRRSTARDGPPGRAAARLGRSPRRAAAHGSSGAASANEDKHNNGLGEFHGKRSVHATRGLLRH